MGQRASTSPGPNGRIRVTGFESSLSVSPPTMLKAASTSAARASAARLPTECMRPLSAGLRRSFATVQDVPVRRYGGLKDQDRIFTNIFSRHDHGIKGAMVRACCEYAWVGVLMHGRTGARRLAQDEGARPQGRRLDHPNHEGLGPARPRGCWIPEWSQVELHEQARMGERPSVSRRVSTARRSAASSLDPLRMTRVTAHSSSYSPTYLTFALPPLLCPLSLCLHLPYTSLS